MSEYSYTSAGKVDFFLKSKAWGIEIVRERDRLEEHVSRFKLGAGYGARNMEKYMLS